jgi:hypothetical protein
MDMSQAHADRPSDGRGDDRHEDTALLPSDEASAILDDLNPARFRPYSRILVVLLFILLYVYITLTALLVTGYLERRTFDIDKIGLVSTVRITFHAGRFRKVYLDMTTDTHSSLSQCLRPLPL